MTAPVTPAVAPAARPTAADTGGGDSAAPFASALDGALSATHPPLDDAGGEGPGQDSDSQDGTPGAAVAEQPAAHPGVVAALWALLTGAGRPAPSEGDASATAASGNDGVAAFPVGTPVAAGKGHVPGTAPGLAVAAARADGSAAGPSAAGPSAAGPSGAGPAKPAGAASPLRSVPGLPEGATVVAVTVGATAAGPEAVSAGRNVAAAVVPGPIAAAVAAAQASAGAVAGAADGAAPTQTTTGTGGAATTTAAALSGSTAPITGQGAGQGTGQGAGQGTGQGAGQGGLGSGTTGQGAAASRTESATAAAPLENIAAGALGATAPATPTATGPAAAAAAPPVAGQIAQQVAVLRNGPDGAHSMTVVLTPETLGTVEVSVTVSQGNVELTLRGAHEHGRAALLDALPDLRRDLEAAGLNCSRLDVDRGTRDGSGSAASQFGERGSGDRGAGDRGGDQQRSEGESRSWPRPADNGEGRPAPAGTRAASSGVDVRV